MLCLTIACGHARPPPPVAIDYHPVATQAAPPEGDLYAHCLAATSHYAHARDADTSLLLFTCEGDPARAFYDGLAAWSAKIGSEFKSAGRTFRSTSRVRRDLFGVDYCATDGTRYECVVTLNAGPFVP
ncbi:MAG: hypothetical protein ABJE66_04260 [Deltaproteobacteria bacterium]